MALSIISAADEGIKRLEGLTERGEDRLLNIRYQDALILSTEVGPSELSLLLSPFDIKRLGSYSSNLLDYHVILDLVPKLAHLHFEKRLGPSVHLSAVQSAILLAIGLQRKTIEEVEAELQLPVSQALALFVKVIRKVVQRLQEVQKESLSGDNEGGKEVPLANSHSKRDDVQNDSSQTVLRHETEGVPETSEGSRAFKEKQREMIQALDLSK